MQTKGEFTRGNPDVVRRPTTPQQLLQVIMWATENDPILRSYGNTAVRAIRLEHAAAVFHGQDDPVDARIAELQTKGWDWHSAYLRAKIDDHRASAEFDQPESGLPS